MHVISCTHLTKQSGPDGQVHGFPGPDGTGKTTTIRMLPGLIAPTGGRRAGCWPPRGCPSGQPESPPSRRHFRALATAEDSTWHVHFRVTLCMPDRPYLRLTDPPGIDDNSASGKSYREGGPT